MNEATFSRARNRSMRHVARILLNLLESEIPANAEVFYAPGTDYVERYRTQFGMMNTMVLLSDLARSRLSHAEANIVIEEAGKLLRHNG